MEKKRTVELNLNKLYSPEVPSQRRMEEYIDKAKMIIGYDNHEEASVIITGTAPVWLLTKICMRLLPWVKEVDYIIKDTTYNILSANEKVLLTKPRRRKKL